jgi:hypothetical protein
MRQLITGMAAGFGLAAVCIALGTSISSKAIRPTQQLPADLPGSTTYAQPMGGSGYGRNWQPLQP